MVYEEFNDNLSKHLKEIRGGNKIMNSLITRIAFAIT